MNQRLSPSAFTLVELMIVAAILVIAIVALLGAFLSQLTLNEHARNLTWAVNDANRVMERLRQQNTGCAPTPTAAVPSECDATGIPADNCTEACASWDAWLGDACNGGKSILPNPAVNELVVPTIAGADPLNVTIAICWRHRNRIIGECRATGGVGPGLEAWEPLVVPNDTAAIESPAMLSTLMTCR